MFRVHWLRSSLLLLLLAGAFCLSPAAHAQSTPQVCDVDVDGDVDKVDINLIANARGKAASGPTDPRDPDRDNTITSADARTCTARCTFAKCASPTNRPPIADAGPDQTVFTDQQVTLDGSDSTDPDGDPLTFRWSFVRKPAGSNATLASATTVSPRFTPDVDGVYEIQLIVRDGQVDSAPDTVVITTGNAPPVADAGDDQTVVVNQRVTLDGSGSSDINGDPLTYSWSFVSRPSGSNATLSSSTAVMPTFTPDRAGIYRLRLIVNDGQVNSQPDEVVIDTRVQPNEPPIADAGDDQTVDLNATVTLDGSGSHDPDAGPSPLTYAWSILTRPATSTAVLSSTTAVGPTFRADKAGEYVIQLIVNDGADSSAPDTVRITTRNTRPVADAGDDQTRNVADTVPLDGTGSFDDDGDPLSYQWSFTSRPNGSNATIANPSQPTTSFVADIAGMYVVQLVVNDGQFDSLPDTATITVNANNLNQISIDDLTVTEGNSSSRSVTFTARRANPSGTSTVTFQTADGTATVAGNDYIANSGTVTFGAGATTRPVGVSVRGDTVVEPDETFFVNLSNPSANASIVDPQATGTIANDDSATLPVVSITAFDPTATEAGPTSGTLRISRTGALTSALVVNVTINGTATNGTDYQTLATSVTIPASQATVNVTVTPIDDAAVEGSETVVMTLAAAATYTIGTPSSATVNIADNDTAALPTVTITATDANASETGPDAGVMRISRTGSTAATLTVSMNTTGSTASNSTDFLTVNNAVVIPAGAAFVDLTFTPIDDALVEGTETIVRTINASSAYTVGTPNSATVNLADNDSLPTVTITATDANASETGPDAGVMRISRTGSTAATLTVSTNATGSTATNSTDYATVNTSVVIPAGAAFVDLTFTPIDDALVEGAETIVRTINASSAYTVGTPNSATVNIADNDTAALPVVSITALDIAASETGPNPGVLRFSRTGSTSQQLTVRTTRTGTATAGIDYTQDLAGTNFLIPIGASFVDVTFIPVDDTAVEGAETILVTLFANAAYTIGTPDTATITIEDNDTALPTVTVTASDSSAAEGTGNPGQFSFNRTGATTNSLVVNFTITGTAVNGTDYTTIGTSVTIPAGQSSGLVSVLPIDDTTQEGAETVIATLAAGSYQIGAPNSATVTIVANDEPVAPTVTMTANDAAATEASGNPGQFTVSRGGATTNALTVNYSIGGSATNGTDYATLSGNVTLAAGAASAVINVNPIDDTLVESAETVGLSLLSSANYTVGSPAGGTVTITENDVGSLLEFITRTQAIGENLQLANGVRMLTGQAPAGGLALRITSSNPNVLLSATETGTGTQTLDISIAANQTQSNSFYVYGLASSGSASLTISVLTTPNPGFTPGTPATVNLVPNGFEFHCQSSSCTSTSNQYTINTTAQAAPVLLYIQATALDPGNPNNNRLSQQDVRGGTSITLPLTLSNTNLGQFRANNNGTPGSVITQLVITAGNYYTYLFFDPNDSGNGSGTAGFTRPSGSGIPVVSGTPYLQSMAINVAGSTVVEFATTTLTVGKDLTSSNNYVRAAAGVAPAGGLQVRLSSSTPNALLSTSLTVAGTQTLDLTIPAGQSQSPLFFVQSLVATGTANITIQILTSPNPGFTTGPPLVVTMVRSGFEILCQTQGCTFANGVYTLTTPRVNAPNLLYIQASALNTSTTNNRIANQTVRGGFTLNLPIQFSNGSIGTLRAYNNGTPGTTISQLAISGNYYAYFYFDPNENSSGGNGTISFTLPTGSGVVLNGGQPYLQTMPVVVTQ